VAESQRILGWVRSSRRHKRRGHPRQNRDEDRTFKSAPKNAIYTPASVLMALRM
jgi:hypothetical protein